MDDLRTQVFKKMGFKRKDDGHKVFWRTDEKLFLEPLPAVDEYWEVCAKWLVPFMGLRDIEYDVQRNYFIWGRLTPYAHNRRATYVSPIAKAEIKGDNIAKAACEAFLEVEL